MKKYTVKEAIELNGANQEVGTVVELTDSMAASFGDKIELVADDKDIAVE